MLQGIQRGADLPQKNQGVSSHQKQENSGLNVSAAHYSSDKVTLSYENDKGDKVKLEMEHSQFHSVKMENYSDADKEKWQSIVKDIREQFEQFKADAIADMLNLSDGESQAGGVNLNIEKMSPDELQIKTDELIEKMPEMWRPEAVSDRIVEFATNFFGSTESEGEDFYNLAISSIEEGFKLAGDDLGKLPGDIANVIKQTRELVMEKLERWAEEQGIISRENISPENDSPLEAGGVDLSA